MHYKTNYKLGNIGLSYREGNWRDHAMKGFQAHTLHIIKSLYNTTAKIIRTMTLASNLINAKIKRKMFCVKFFIIICSLFCYKKPSTY